MKTSHAALLLLVASAPLAGCASAERAYAREPEHQLEAGVEPAGIRFDDASIEESFRRAEQLPVPMRLAVVGVERNPYGVFEDVELHAFEQSLAGDASVYSDVVPLVEFLVGPSRRRMDLAHLRAVAARAHADALLIYDQSVSVRDRFNALSLLNITLVGNWIFPGSSYELGLDTRAALVDVRNGVVYTAVRDVRRTDGVAPSGSVDGYARDAKRKLRSEAFAALRDALRKKIEGLHARGDAPPSGPRYRTDEGR